MNKAAAIHALSGFTVSPLMIIDDQTVDDIVAYLPVAHNAYGKMYDRLALCLEETTAELICEEIFDFCRENLRYNEESVEDQRLSSPVAMLRRGWSDCKGYALFAGGLLDALNRRGAHIDWCFRFVPSQSLGVSIGHVFVVCEVGGGETVWIDPVIETFDKRTFFLVHRDVYPRPAAAAVGKLSGVGAVHAKRMPSSRRVGASNEANLLTQLNEYTLGLQDAMSISIGNNTLNTITAGVLQTASAVIPGLSAVLGLLKDATTVLSNAFGAGSFAARLMSDISTNLLTAPYTLVKTILDPGERTFESDQYYGAAYYYYYVEGQTKYKNAPQQVSDQQVLPALKWFIDRLGVFISGREHIEALVQGVEQYMALFSVNGDTTTDLTAVQQAVAVAQQYFNFSGAAGSWADTVGVYDVQLIEIANEMGESVEQAASQDVTNGLGVPVYANPVADTSTIIQDPIVVAAAAVLIIILLL